ncbi:XdhC family protein [Pseudooceanicola sp. CBS1P-1]|uniref:XdhC/CoxI family protein n=1 Tax=Pseudooceanicola albus TaxID=2692189 RepID=A0A6L7G0Q0_9RHOB|nr:MULTISPECIES: XdhC/CoxI family protein [Pseudooceanicola]MBT9382475.1 XdhC family protein [Pseudooceanicola endophyticus]MXN17016.1 XdhC/CoxI family protein [Pseudooceanicola albus]
MERFDDIPEQALDWYRAGRGAALATVVETWGSAPRRVGSQLAISGDGAMAGSVSGGCVEGAVVLEAQEAIADGKPRMLEYGVSDGDAFAVGLACGGTIRVLVQPVGGAFPDVALAELVERRAARARIAVVSGADGRVEGLVQEGFEARFRMDRSGLEEDGRFVTVHNPPLRLLIVGAVHIAQALVPMARVAGFDPVVIDPRDSFASAARFPGEQVINDWPDEAVQALGLDARTALVLLTHDPKIDDPALEEALRSDVFYIGALGSTRTHARRLDRMEAAGLGAELERIHGPIGLDIGASGPAEIAVSILAEMVQVLRKGAA